MARIPTPIPESVAKTASNIARGPLLDAVWWALVTSAILATVVLLLAVSPAFGGIIAGLLVALLIRDDVRAAVRDVYRRDFWVFST